MRPAPLLLGIVAALCGCDRPSIRSAEGRPDGAKIYSMYCAGCHGPDGRRPTTAGLLTDAASKPEADLAAVVTDGRKAMPPFRKQLQDDEIAAVARYVKTLRPER